MRTFLVSRELSCKIILISKFLMKDSYETEIT